MAWEGDAFEWAGGGAAARPGREPPAAGGVAAGGGGDRLICAVGGGDALALEVLAPVEGSGVDDKAGREGGGERSI